MLLNIRRNYFQGFVGLKAWRAYLFTRNALIVVINWSSFVVCNTASYLVSDFSTYLFSVCIKDRAPGERSPFEQAADF